jgi:hypothetical protein
VAAQPTGSARCLNYYNLSSWLSYPAYLLQLTPHFWDINLRKHNQKAHTVHQMKLHLPRNAKSRLAIGRQKQEWVVVF